MAKYRLYAGLGGGFGGAEYHGTRDFKDEEEAMQAAHDLAVEEYQSYEELHSVMDWAECEKECREEGLFTEDMCEDTIGRWIDDRYNEEIESWIEYDIQEVSDEDEDIDFEEV